MTPKQPAIGGVCREVKVLSWIFTSMDRRNSTLISSVLSIDVFVFVLKVLLRMKKRYFYTLIFCIPAFLIALIISVLLSAAIVGVLWLYVWGDSAWPGNIDHFLLVVFIFLFFAIWAMLIGCAYMAGKRLEAQAEASSKRAITGAMGATVMLLLLIIFHQWRIGNLGPESNSSACTDFCRDNGYAASMISIAGDCSCLGAQGQVRIKTPMAALRARGY